MKKFLTICTVIMMLTIPVEVYADGLKYVPVTPCRIADTRISQGGSGPIPSGTQRNFMAAGLCNVPFGPAKAISINIAATNATGPGYLTAFAYPHTIPLASVLKYTNQPAWAAVSNSVVIQICDNEIQSCSFDFSEI